MIKLISSLKSFRKAIVKNRAIPRLKSIKKAVDNRQFDRFLEDFSVLQSSKKNELRNLTFEPF